MRQPACHPTFASEVREIFAYYEEVSPKLADEFWAELGDTLKYAQQFREVVRLERVRIQMSSI